MVLGSRDYGETNFVTGMRAFAALGVLLIHAGGGGLRSLGVMGNLIVDMGRTGVYVFFVISGFSIAAVFQKNRRYDIFLWKRYFRLAPLFYFWYLLIALTVGAKTYWAQAMGWSFCGYDLVMHIFFLHAFDARTANSVIGVEWSLGVEVFWYLWLPWLLRGVKAGYGWKLCVLGLGWYAWSHGRASQNEFQLATVDFLWSPFSYGLNFVLGIWAFHLRQKYDLMRNSLGFMGVLVLGIFYMSFWWLKGRPMINMYYFSTLFAFLLLLVGSSKEVLCRWVFCNPIALNIGTVSYGVYLSHSPLLELLKYLDLPALKNELVLFVVLALTSIALSMVLYIFLERPCTKVGKILEERYWGSKLSVS